jgi:hypothetical protein
MNYSEKNISHLSDNELVALYKKTDETMFIGAAYKRYAHLVYGMCVLYFKDKNLANISTFRIFEKLVDELKRREMANFRTWLASLVRNHCVGELQKIRVEVLTNHRRY